MVRSEGKSVQAAWKTSMSCIFLISVHTDLRATKRAEIRGDKEDLQSVLRQPLESCPHFSTDLRKERKEKCKPFMHAVVPLLFITLSGFTLVGID